ncbi:MAG: hypothetical protein M3O30_10175 [Planctomycetota bacterium]|nr:hypothetical protein [Planctomycetota bacterium]
MTGNPPSLSPRKFLKTTAATAAAIDLSRLTAKSYAQIIGFNEDVRHAVIGCNDCGRAHIKQFISLNGVRLVGLCDVDTVLSYQLGRQAAPDEIKAALGAQPPAQETLSRFQAHLDANDVHLDMNKAQLGVPLQVDPQTVKFIGNDAANAMLTRTYREPFVVPQTV